MAQTSFSASLSEGLSKTKLEGLTFVNFIKTPDERKRVGIKCVSTLKKKVK